MKLGVRAVRSTAAMAAIADPLLGTEVRKFKLVRMIGRGGMGRVYEGVHEEIGSRVAIKVIAEQYAQDADHAERFFAEARAVNMIRHDGIVNIFDLDRLADGRPVIVMEYVEGQTLRQRMQAGRLPLGGLVGAIAQVLGTLHAAHAIGIVHRDLKPDNIMITPSGHTKVLDFGIAKLLAPPEGHSAPRTRTGVVLGTPEYMAPEQIDEGVADARTDVYAIGIVLFEAIVGRRPFDGPSDYAIMRAQVETPPPSLRVARPDVPSELEHVILAALAKRPRDRFRNAKAFATALANAAQLLPESEWRSLATDGGPIRPPVAIPTTEPSPAESLPTAPVIPVAEMHTAKATPRARDSGLDALRSSRHTADAVKPNAPAPVVAQPPRRARRAIIVALLGVAALGGAAVIAYKLGAKPTQTAETVEPPPIETDPIASLDARPSPPPIDATMQVVVADVPADAAPRIAETTRKRPDAGTPPTEKKTNQTSASTGPEPARGSAWGPIPEKYRSIPGIKIDPSTSVLTASRVSLEAPSPGSGLDYVAYAATARQLARKLESDAELTSFQVTVLHDGVTKRPPIYYFVSKQARESNDGGRLACISVNVEPWDEPIVRASAGITVACDKAPPIRLPKCSPAHVAKQFPGDDEWYWVNYDSTGWRIGHQSNGAIIAKFRDDC